MMASVSATTFAAILARALRLFLATEASGRHPGPAQSGRLKGAPTVSGAGQLENRPVRVLRSQWLHLMHVQSQPHHGIPEAIVRIKEPYLSLMFANRQMLCIPVDREVYYGA